MINCDLEPCSSLAFAESADLRKVGKIALEGARLSHSFSEFY